MIPDVFKENQNSIKDSLHSINAKVNKIIRLIDSDSLIDYKELNDIRILTAIIERLDRKTFLPDETFRSEIKNSA